MKYLVTLWAAQSPGGRGGAIAVEGLHSAWIASVPLSRSANVAGLGAIYAFDRGLATFRDSLVIDPNSRSNFDHRVVSATHGDIFGGEFRGIIDGDVFN